MSREPSSKVLEPDEEENSGNSQQSLVPLRPWWVRWGAPLLFFLILYVSLTTWMSGSLLATGKVAPDFQLTTLKGERMSLRQFRGKRVILHFWATWCHACKTNLYMLRALQSQYRSNPILLSIVADPEHRQSIRALQRKHGLRYPILLADRQVLRRYHIQRYPSTYFLDRKGRIVAKDAGVITPLGLWWRNFWVWLYGA